MGVKSVKLGATLSFDDVREADILNAIESLRGRHKLGEFISNLLRVAFESPEKLESKAELSKLMTDLGERGISWERAEYFRQLNSEVQDMKRKVDAIYDMAYKNYTMAALGKRLGMEEKSQGSLRAQFVLQRQLSAMAEIVGASMTDPYESNRLQEVKAKADELMEYIIESYDGIVKEIKEEIDVERAPVRIQEEVKQEKEVVSEGIGEVISVEEEEEDDDEVISFDANAMSALSDFFGEG